ncbi:hypothetical protein [Thermovibrio ammonificans]
MEILVVGPVRGNVERFKGLVEVASPDLVVAIGPLGLSEPLKLGRTWFFVRGKEDSLTPLAKSDGIDMLSRVFRTKEGVTFSGISGYYDPVASKFTRAQWVKARGKLSKRHGNAVFAEDIEALLVPFQRAGIERLDFLVLADSPERPPFKRVVEITRPRYLFYPAASYRKERVGDTVYIGLEDVDSPKGKYLLKL